MRVLLLERFPHRGRALANAFLGDEFAGQRGEDVVVLFHRGQTVVGELAFERQRHEHLFAHQPKTAFLGRAGITHVANAHGLFLADTPAAPACLSQYMGRIAGLVNKCSAEHFFTNVKLSVMRS